MGVLDVALEQVAVEAVEGVAGVAACGAGGVGIAHSVQMSLHCFSLMASCRAGRMWFAKSLACLSIRFPVAR